ncbi:MAG: putative lipid II flippase FtsW [Bacillota bacterium]
MDRGEPLKIKAQGHMDFPMLLTILLLCAFGIVMVFSASYYWAQHYQGDGYYYIKKQLQFLAIGIVVMLVASRVNYRFLDKMKWYIVGVSIAMLVAVLIFGVERNGGKRWFEIAGISIQPSEIAKFAMTLWMAAFMSRRAALMKSFARGVVPMLMVMLLVCGLILLQPNLSMAVSIGMIGMAMLFVGGAKSKHLMLLLVAAAGAFVLLVLAADYRIDRVTIFLDPWKDEKDKGYQLIQSLYALGSGGIFGTGLNYSRQKLLYLTYGESDFIFSIIGEELGWIGGVCVIAAYLFLIYRGVRVAMRCKDHFGSLLAVGITVTLAVQVMVHIGVVTSSIPPTGQTLPFISAGGSSLVVYLAQMGVLLNISREAHSP